MKVALNPNWPFSRAVGALLVLVVADQCLATTATNPEAVAALPARVIELSAAPEAATLESCTEVLSREFPEKPSAKAPRAKPAREPKHDTSGMTIVTLNSDRSGFGSLPGYNLESIPPQDFEGNEQSLSRVAAVMNRAKAGGRIRLSFFGASHTEFDGWTGHIRLLLQRRHGNIGHGFGMPAAPRPGYRQQDITICASNGWKGDWAYNRNGPSDGFLGFAGMSIASANARDFGWIETTEPTESGGDIDHFEVFTLGGPDQGTLLVRIDNLPVQEIDNAADEYRMLRTRIDVRGGARRISVSPKGNGEVRIFGISSERRGSGVLVDSMGVRGQTARSWLKWNRTMASQGLATIKPDLVVLAYGTNEAAARRLDLERYQQDLRAVLKELRQALPDAACVLVGPSDRAVKIRNWQYAIWPNTEFVAQVQRATAPEFGCVFWDWQKVQGGPGSQIAWAVREPAMASQDLIHFRTAGYQWIAERFVTALESATLRGKPN